MFITFIAANTPKAQTWTNDYKYVYVSVLHEYLYILSQSHSLNFTSAKQSNKWLFFFLNGQTELLLTDVFTTKDMQRTRTRTRVTYWIIPDTATPVFDNLPHCYIIPDYICQIFKSPYTVSVIVYWAIKSLSQESIIVAELGSCLKVQVFLA